MIEKVKNLSRTRRIWLFIVVGLAALIFAGIVWLIVLEAQVQAIAAILGFIGFSGLFLASYGIISLITRRGRRGAGIACLAVGANLIAPVLYLLLMVSLSKLHIATTDPLVLDYTAEEAKIESVSMIKLESFNSSAAELSYRITRDIDKSRWPQIIDELKGFEFRRPFGDPRTRMYKDYRMLMIVFSEPTADGTTRAFISEYGIFINRRDETDGSACSLDYSSYWAVSFDECEAFIDSLITG